MRASIQQHIKLGKRRVEYRLVRSKAACKLRVRVGMSGVEVVQPKARKVAEVETFLRSNATWVLNQLDRIDRLRVVRKPRRNHANEILYRGTRTPVRLRTAAHSTKTNKVVFERSCLQVTCGCGARTCPAKSLENWLRRQAREAIQQQLYIATRRLKRFPRKVYVMGQRTKWGNCSARQNLSFNWRIILAPDYVLRYLVTHEVVHLAVPDHSNRFWLTVQSLCPETEIAKQWLRANGEKLYVDLVETCRLFGS